MLNLKFKIQDSRFKIQDSKLLFTFFLLAIPLLLPTSSAAGGAEDASKVVVSTRPLGINHIITEGDVRVVTIERYDPRDAVELSEVIGKRVRRPIGMNNTIKRDYLQDAPVIRNGERVIIFAEKGNLRISVKGEAKEDGFIGERVMVENISSGKLITGKVIEPGLVRVDF